MKLGTLLLRDGVITLDQLEAALRAQVLFGGKLGSNLVELGHLSLDTLAVYLGRALGMPAATRDRFETADPLARPRVPGPVAQEYGAYPLGFTGDDGRALAVALANPDRRLLDSLERAVGMKLVPHVAPELTIEEYLERHYGIERKTRVRVATPPARRPTPPPVAPPVAPAPRPPPAAGGAAAVHGGPPASLALTLSLLESAVTRDEIGEAVLRFARGRLDTCLLFLVRQDQALGWKGFSPGLDAAHAQEELEDVVVDLWAPSCLGIAFGSHAYWRGDPRGMDQPLFAALHSDAPTDAFAAPILAGRHAVNLIYGHAAGGHHIDDALIDAMAAVTDAAGEAYARLVGAARARVT